MGQNTIGVVRESMPSELRVALVPAHIPVLRQAGWTVQVERGAGSAAGYPDADYEAKGATLSATRDEVFAAADVVLQVRCLGANPQTGEADVPRLRAGQVLIGFADPLTSAPAAATLAARGVALLAIELVPRITRAQSMDALSSMNTILGYKAVLLAAHTLPRMFPMLMTAAGTLTPSRVFVIGAGVAGLQAAATARRLGALVDAYDVRPAVKDQVISVGAKFVELELDTKDAEGAGGYAKTMGEEFYQKQRQLMARVLAQSHVVISTAVVPGQKAPILITADAVKGMPPGSVIVDLAAERGGNCELTRPDETVVAHGVTILGPTNLASSVPLHASQMYSKNLVTLLQHLTPKEGGLRLDAQDEITAAMLVTRDGQVVHPRIRTLLGLPDLAPAAEAEAAPPSAQ